MTLRRVALAAVSDGDGVLDPRGPVSEAIADLWWLMLALGVAVFVLFVGLLVAAFLREPPESSDQQRHDRLVWRWIGLGGVTMPTLVIVGVFVATLVAMVNMPRDVTADALEIEITGHRFWYEIEYPDAGLVTANELHLPTGRQVALRLASADVIHSFWVPELAGKLDMLPERTNTLILQADEPGVYRSRCAEFCGLSHANMSLVVVAEAASDFDRWLSEQQAHAAASGDAAMRGRDVFVAADCVSCHAAPGVDAEDADGPDLTTLPGRRTIGAGLLPNTPDNVADWIRDPTTIKPGVEMPATDLTDAEIDALLTYLGLEP